MSLTASFFARPAPEVARELIGCTLRLGGVGGAIVETEAYTADDPASHSFIGERPRNRAMFGPPGRAYVYRSYGIHWCFNIVCADAGAVLIRALEPRFGMDEMVARRGLSDLRLLCSGPGRVAQALGIDIGHDHAPLDQSPFEIDAAAGAVEIICGPRIGISKAVEVPWRFGLAGSRFLSRKFG
ncbi:MAG: DNA-3-methyladenine glycosylase [Mesorhizobium sp.]